MVKIIQLLNGRKKNIIFWIEQTEDRSFCSKCGWKSSIVKDVHYRKIQDTPIHNKNVYVNVKVREFKCKNKNGEINTYTEELPFVAKNQVRTYALTEFIIYQF